MQQEINKIGHVHLKVRRLETSLPFYTEILGLRITERVGRYAFLSFGREHHDVALNEVGTDSRIPGERDIGLFHFAIAVSTLRELKDCYRRLRAAKIAVEPVDHGISKVLYFDDPDGNGIEVYLDTREATGRTEWQGRSEPLDLEEPRKTVIRRRDDRSTG